MIQIHYKYCLYVWYNSTINWLKYIISIAFINNCFYFWVRIKDFIFCFVIFFSIFLNSKTITVANIKLFDSVNKSIRLCFYGILIIFKLEFRIKRIQDFKIIRTCVTFRSMRSFYYVCIQKFLTFFSPYIGLL